MTNKEAIKILGLECDEWDISHCTASERREAFEMAITALDQLDNNSTKPDNSTATQSNGIESKVKGLTACRVPEDDTISRTDAVEMIESTTWYDPRDTDVAHEVIGALPSVQPLVIHCTDCEDWLERQSILGFTISELPSVQLERKSRLVAEIEGKTPEETYDFLSWLMVDYGVQFTDTRQAVIEWLRGEQDG